MEKCPICNNTKKEYIAKLCSNMEIMGPSFANTDLNVVSCENCGMVYYSSEANEQDYIDYYCSSYSKAVDYYSMFGENETNEYFEHTISLLSPYITNDSEILDIGCGFGELDLCLKKHTSAKITLLDIKRECIERLKKQKFETIKGSSLELKKLYGRKFDVVILNHILEHIPNPIFVLSDISRLLKPNGIVFIEVPDCEKYHENTDKISPFAYLNFEHVLHFSMNDMKNISSICGYSILEYGTYYKKVSEYPSIWMVLKADETVVEMISKSDSKLSIQKYLNHCHDILKEYTRIFKENNKELILWGIGASTAVIINEFAECNIVQLIDSNPSRQGITYNINGKDLIIEAPSELINENASIFVLSGPYKNSICRQINDMGIVNEVYTF